MPTKAILFGAIGVLAETSELQRQCFNQAFAEAGLDWHWTRNLYRDMLTVPGGARRVADMARSDGIRVDDVAIHARKSAILRHRMLDQGLTLRPGIGSVIEAARSNGVRMALVTTTDLENVHTMLAAIADGPTPGEFAFTGHRGMVVQGKPSPEIYELALNQLGLHSGDAIAIEDTPESAAAALGAGIATIAFPGSYHLGRTFPGVLREATVLTPEMLRLSVPA